MLAGSGLEFLVYNIVFCYINQGDFAKVSQKILFSKVLKTLFISASNDICLSFHILLIEQRQNSFTFTFSLTDPVLAWILKQLVFLRHINIDWHKGI